MDLSRGKTILIIAYLLLNIFLGHRLWLNSQGLQAGRMLTGEEADGAREALMQAGFELLAPIPRQIPRLAMLHVSSEEQYRDIWSNVFFGESVPGTVTEGGGMLYTQGRESVRVAPSGLVTYVNSGRAANPGEDSRQVAERFLRDRGLWQEDLRFDQPIAGEPAGAARYRYVQTYQGFPLFFSSVEVLVTDGMVAEVNLVRVAPLGFSGNELQVISAAEAVATFLSHQPEFTDQRVAEISLGYYSQNYDAERWEIVPVWRIAAPDGASFYVNAFTGEAETSGM